MPPNDDSMPVGVRELARGLHPQEPDSLDWFLRWPADLFALTSRCIALIEGYRIPVSLDQPVRTAGRGRPGRQASASAEGYDSWVKSVAKEWRETLKARPMEQWIGTSLDSVLEQAIPKEVWAQWKRFIAGVTAEFEKPLSEILDVSHRDQFDSLLFLHAVADEFFCEPIYDGITLDPVSAFATILLNEGSISRIHWKRGRVLFKEHTPQVGLSMRSVSRNLAFILSPVEISWTRGTLHQPETARSINCLLLPWPLRIHARDFRAAVDGSASSSIPGRSYFDFKPQVGNERTDLSYYIGRCVDAAINEVGSIHLAIAPESSLGYDNSDSDELSRFEMALRERHVDAYVTGVRGLATAAGRGPGINGLVSGGLVGDQSRYARRELQHKHHRWIMDSSQVDQYSLGSILDPELTWYENIQIRPRCLHLFTLGGISVCPLICEDLARQDPVVDVVRALGPSLVVVLLMDGPQFADRWSARYASVLNDDPGSAVVTLTSKGMVRRWRSTWRPQRDVVGLWKGSDGPMREICLTPGSGAIVLSLKLKDITQCTADGRTGSRKTHELKLIGIHQVSVAQE